MTDLEADLMIANARISKLEADNRAMRNELCLYCGKYKLAHKGACDGCKWKKGEGAE